MAASNSLTTCSRTPDRVGSLSCELINKLLGAISEGLARVFPLSRFFNAVSSLVRGVLERSSLPSKYYGTSRLTSVSKLLSLVVRVVIGEATESFFSTSFLAMARVTAQAGYIFISSFVPSEIVGCLIIQGSAVSRPPAKSLPKISDNPSIGTDGWTPTHYTSD